MLFVETELREGTMGPYLAKAVRDSLKGPYVNNWGINVEEAKIARLPNTIEIDVNTVGCKNA